MGEGKPGRLVLRLLGRLLRLILAGAIYALVLWYGVETTEDLDTSPVVTGAVIALVALGIAGSIYRILIDVSKEALGGIVVLAEFLNNHLLEPQRRRLMERGRAQGREEGREEGGKRAGRRAGRRAVPKPGRRSLPKVGPGCKSRESTLILSSH